MELTDLEIEIVKILTLLIDNPNAPDEYGETAIHAVYKSGQIFGFFNANAPNKRENTPIHLPSY